MLINLWVRDKANGHIHQVGTDVHDSIRYIDGKVRYYNLQNGCGTPDGYAWVEAPDMDDYVSVTPKQLWFNREWIHKDLIAMLEKGGEGVKADKTCNTCKANKVCDHNKYGFENCNNYIPDKAGFAEVVRCKDCGMSRETEDERYLFCMQFADTVDCQAFCSYGERRTDDDV